MIQGKCRPSRSANVRRSKQAAKTCLVLRPFAMHGIDGDRCLSCSGFSAASGGLACALPRMERGRSRSRRCDTLRRRIRRRNTASKPPPTRPVPEINIVMVLRDDTTGIYVWSESFRLGLANWFEAQQRIIRRIATSLNVQLSTERLMRLAGEPDVSLDIHDRWLRGQNLMAKFDPESWQRAVAIFRDAIRENPAFSPCYSSLVQMNNIEHFVHPGRFRDLGKARATLELAKTAVQLDPVDSRAHLCCGWSHVMAFREAEAASHMELACELNDNDPWTCCPMRIIAPSADRSSKPGCGPISRWLFRGRPRISNGLTTPPFASCAATMPVLSKPAIARTKSYASCRHGGRRRCSTSGRRPGRGKRRQRFVNGIRSFWVGSSAPTDEAVVRWALQAHPINVSVAMGSPARRIARRRASCRGYRPAIAVGWIFQPQKLIV